MDMVVFKMKLAGVGGQEDPGKVVMQADVDMEEGTNLSWSKGPPWALFQAIVGDVNVLKMFRDNVGKKITVTVSFEDQK